MIELPSRRRLNCLYILVQLCYWAMFSAFAGYQTALLLGRGFTSGDAGALASIRCLAGIFAQPLLGGWADRHPSVPLKRILLACLSAALAVNVVFYTTRPGFFGTALIFLALGILELNAYPLLDSLAVQFINAGVDVNYSLGRGLGSLSYAIVSVFLGRQAAAFGVETVLLSHGVLLLLLMAAVAAYPVFPRSAAPKLPPEDHPHSIFYLLRRDPSFTVMLTAIFFALTAVLPIVSFTVSLIEERGGNETHLGIALFLMAASELPAAILFPHIWRRLGSRGVLVLSIFFMALKPVLFLLAPNLGFLLAVHTIQLLGFGLYTPSSVYYANESVPPADRIRGQTLVMMASNGLGGMVGNLLAGYAIDWGGVNAMLSLSAGFGFIAVLLALLSVRLSKRR